MPRAAEPLRPGHELLLLEGSRAFFPALVEAVDGARREVLLETYIFDFTGSGADVAHALERAARSGVRVRLVVDGVGTPALPPTWRERFTQAGVEWAVYSPPGVLGLLWPGQWRRLHRKLCVVDARIGFCGGINILDDFHDPNHGTLAAPRLDFSLRVEGPLVQEMRATMMRQWSRIEAVGELKRAHVKRALRSLRNARSAAAGPPTSILESDSNVRATLLLRDNLRNRATIERAYLRAIGRAREEIIIANAYFVPGARMRRALVTAAGRGVRVCLLLQGRYEYFMQYYAARPVFGALLRAGVQIHEYAPSFLHAKVAVIDGHWATVGSTNLDPLSLLLAREGNVVVDDRRFAQRLRERLLHAMEHDGTTMDPAAYEKRSRLQRIKERVAFVVMRLLLGVQGKKYL
ncbi:MAG: cardiolipin synthetase (Cardiolipin synthase)-like protein [Ramlibacter sp.]|jgi:cardiolipin synthase|nr:cardiolipin synthetase (Cardiolipin synthase)-like protein [Ramlibacter sp.]MDB5915440.1 cardiolipin synthetase (Cardiolipin synthase)-like protein [Ramlibacter sp.]